MKNKKQNIQEQFIETIGNFGESLGLNRTVCQMYALLYISPEPLTPTKIAELLGISKGNVSINMRKLEEWNAVRRVWRKGYARAVFEANENFEEIITQKLKTGLQKRARIMNDSLSAIAKNAQSMNPESDKKANDRLNQKITNIKNLSQKLELIVKNIDSIRSLLKK